jgi:Putative beta-barrel porin-2, OmpL-like. bbp2
LKYLVAAFTAACAFGAVPALAQTVSPTPSPSAPPATKPAAAAPPVPAASAAPSPSASPRAWVPSGFAATSFTAFSNHTPAFANGASSRTFDNLDRQPLLNALNVQLQKNGTLGGKLELTAGTNADVIASYPDLTGDAFDVTQAYLSYTGGPLTLQAGKFATLAGAEVIEDPANLNVSRSVLFGFAVPFTHTGARLTYAPTSLFSAIVGINNGWDNLKGNGTGAHTGEFGLAYNGSALTVTAQAYTGTERITNVPFADTTGHRTLFDAVATYHATPKLTFVVNGDRGQQENVPLLDGTGAPTGLVGTASWGGAAGYVSYQLTPRFSAALRGELFSDGGGYRTGFDQHLREGTLTLAYAPSSALLFRLEGRADRSNLPVYSAGPGLGNVGVQSIGAQAIVKF